ncbi:aspartyl-phosphate phosphatase Spo0E family protein [Paenibacillus xerothermodurans]|uniref:Aspartyl-phosphate phosphatase Spo0E family protein n=1 Tax=Paenibacillus xerothermodurans TaxID=1977292 RepID=A0A2W1NA99_PAEXE|nr:aspartyl-phosphate phosphatase Spo0E family protein [Paenibacillus xerothermodurans]PZE21307.1 aspartyl-phosphate phosphatase Spo0E family protein [Paenibacillus xerothermodurans]
MLPTSDKLSELSAEIEQVRTQLVESAVELGFMHPQVQQTSKRLDTLLLRYYEINKNKKAPLSIDLS